MDWFINVQDRRNPVIPEKIGEPFAYPALYLFTFVLAAVNFASVRDKTFCLSDICLEMAQERF